MKRAIRQALSGVPRPPGEILDPGGAPFIPDPDLADWVREYLILEEAPLHNPDHAHLARATIGWLWTNVDVARRGRTLIGQCERMPPMVMGKWQKERSLWQLEQWFDGLPDFVITLHAPYCSTVDEASVLALVEHEMYHAAQKTDAFGQPRYNHMGAPIWDIRGHDVEEFVGVVRRYGAAAAQVEALVEAAGRRPEIDGATIAAACGTCLRLAA